MKQEMIELCGLWQHKDKNGDPFYTGKINGVSVLVFKNKNKKGKQPDFRVFLAPPKQEEKPAEDPGFIPF